MSIRIIPKENQGQGAFNGGEIIENKPIGFPQDRSSVRPYSNLFYWAHAKAVTDSTIGLHPHQGFEICSFVLKGEIRHYDTKLRDWRPLSAGDVQIIRAGNGISHSEFMGKGGEMFQIWFDPNLNKTLAQAASYDDYKKADFPEMTTGNTKVTTLAGNGSPFRMDTPGIEVKRIQLAGGRYEELLPPNRIASLYLIEGEAQINDQPIGASDFIMVEAEEKLTFSSESVADIFVIFSPAKLEYPTYAQLMASR
ncbi:MAG: pirin family protein [Saprospiraceae bacterium]|nr:pirin family protein [Saprospiraceae bacterium]